MSSTSRIPARATIEVRVLVVIAALSCACLATLCVSQDAAAQSSVPHPPVSQKQQVQSVPHPPEAPKQETTDSSDQPNTTFKVNVKLVNVFTTVTTSGGAPVSSLKEEDFQVFEDGKLQKIAVFHRESELPLSIVVAIDTSLSTR